MNNIQKAFKKKADCAHMADGGFVEPSIGGFIKDRLGALKDALTPAAPKVVANLRNVPSRIDRAVDRAVDNAVAAGPAPLPAAPVEEPPKPIRFANGGGVQSLRQLGAVRGPGTGTSDDIPAMLSNGEYVLPADTVDHVGIENLDALKDATHNYVGEDDDTDVSARQYADGGFVEPSIGGFIKDRFMALKDTLTPAAPKVVANLRNAPSRIDQAVDAAVAAAPTPRAPVAEEPPKPFRFADGGAVNMDSLRRRQSFAASPISDAQYAARDERTAAALNRAASRPTATPPPPLAGGAPSAPATAAAPAAPKPTWAGRLRGLGTGGILGLAGRVATPLTGAYDLAEGLRTGDNFRAGVGAVDSLAGLASFTPAATIALPYLGLRGAYQGGQLVGSGINAAMSDDSRDAIGSAVNAGVRGAGKMIGQDWGVDDTNYQKMEQQRAEEERRNPTLKKPVGPAGFSPAIDGAAPPVVSPTRLGANRSPITKDGNIFSGTGTTADDAGMMQDQRVAMNVARDERTSNLSREVGNLRSAEMDRGTLGFGGGRRRVSAAQANVEAQRDATMLGERNNIRSAMTAQLNNERQQAQNLRQMNFDRAKFGIEQQNREREFANKDRELGNTEERNNLDARGQGLKSLTDRLATMTPAGADGKPDTALIAQKAAAVDSFLGDRIKALQEHIKLNPGDRNAASELRNINERGHSAIDPKTLNTIIAGVDAARTADEYSTGPLNPIGGRAVVDNRPITSLRKTGNGFLGFGGEYTSNRGDRIPARAIESDGSSLYGKQNNKFRDLIEAGKKSGVNNG